MGSRGSREMIGFIGVIGIGVIGIGLIGIGVIGIGIGVGV